MNNSTLWATVLYVLQVLRSRNFCTMLTPTTDWQQLLPAFNRWSGAGSGRCLSTDPDMEMI